MCCHLACNLFNFRWQHSIWYFSKYALFCTIKHNLHLYAICAVLSNLHLYVICVVISSDYLLPPQANQAWGFWCIFCPTSVQLAGAKCGCSEEVPQLSLYPLRFFPSPLSRHEHTLQGCFLYPIPTGLALSTQIAPLLRHWGGLAWRRGRDGVESVSPFPRGSIVKLRRGALPLWSNFIVSPFVGLSSTSRRGHPDGGRFGLSPSPQASTRYQSSQRSAGMLVGPENKGDGSKIWQ